MFVRKTAENLTVLDRPYSIVLKSVGIEWVGEKDWVHAVAHNGTNLWWRPLDIVPCHTSGRKNARKSEKDV